jgi:hypothetical protein
MLLYHGSNKEVSTPDLKKSKRYLDFGKGFYLTSNKNQAIEFSGKVVARAKKRGEASGIAIVSMYEFDLDAASESLRILRFGLADGAWLDYVVGNRQGLILADDFDIVIGPVANDDIFEVVELYEDGTFTKEVAINAMKVKKLFNQYALKSPAAIEKLRYIGSRIV